MLPPTLALLVVIARPWSHTHPSGLQSYGFSKALLVASIFKGGRGLGRSPQACPAWRKKMLGLTGNNACKAHQPSTAECCGCSFLCVPAACSSDQSKGWKLQGCPCLGPDLLCNLRDPSLHSDLVTLSANWRHISMYC